MQAITFTRIIHLLVCKPVRVYAEILSCFFSIRKSFDFHIGSKKGPAPKQQEEYVTQID